MKNIKAVFMKQMLDTVKNKTVLIQFLMFPIMAVIMENAVKIEGSPEHFFAKLFAVMFIGMAPLSSMSAIISEEKEKNTLRVLMMSGVKPWQYLVAIGLYIFIMCIAGTAVFAILTEYRGIEFMKFIFSMIFGIILSEIIGAMIGIFSKNQMSATSITLPVMMIFSFSPMLSMFNKTVKKFTEITYLQQISNILNGVDGSLKIQAKSVVVISANFIIAFALFFVAYNKKGLE